MKIDSAAVSGRRGGFETRLYPGAVGRNRLFHRPYVAFARPWCFPRRARPVPRYGAGIQVGGGARPLCEPTLEGPATLSVRVQTSRDFSVPHSPPHTTPNVTLRPQPKGLAGRGILNGPPRAHPPSGSSLRSERHGGARSAPVINSEQLPLSLCLDCIEHIYYYYITSSPFAFTTPRVAIPQGRVPRACFTICGHLFPLS